MSDLKLIRTRLYLGDPADPAAAVEVDVMILPGDRMRAERLSTDVLHPSQRGTAARRVHAETWMLLWLWCSYTRTTGTAVAFERFTGELLSYAELDAAGELVPDDAPLEADEVETVPPTPPAALTSSL